MKKVQTSRRRFLAIATSFVSGVGIAAVSIPFLGYWKPSQKALNAGAPVKVDVSKIESGAMITVEWQGKPVWILRRTEKNLENLLLSNHLAKLRDPESIINQQPEYAKNNFRSLREEVLIVVGICTHLGCVPTYKPNGHSEENNGLYFCPCHGSKFDLAGRVFKKVPAPTNLMVPPHRYLSERIVEIGSDKVILDNS